MLRSKLNKIDLTPNVHPKAIANLMQGLVESDHELFEMERREKRNKSGQNKMPNL